MSFVVIVEDENSFEMALEDGLKVFLLDFSEDENLIEMGITIDVETLFCMSEEYDKNLFVTLSARNLDKDLKIISLVSTLLDEKKMYLAGANETINPYVAGANQIYRLIKKPTVYDILDEMLFSNLDIKIYEVLIPKDSYLEGVLFNKMGVEERFDLMVMGMQERNRVNSFRFNTHKIHHKIKFGDILVIIGSHENIEAFKKELG